MGERRRDRIYAAVVEGTGRIDLDHIEASLRRLGVAQIAAAVGTTPNNASSELQHLHRSGELMRIGGRPVAYADPATLARTLGMKPTGKSFANAKSFADFLVSNPEKTGIATGATPSFSVQAGAVSDFDSLIGARGSLFEPIKQAKAAMLYPPGGLHALITGPSGVGKSQFASCMFDYAAKSGMLAQGTSLVTFNCASYSDNPQLLLAHLFGYVKGAFTGADRDHTGLVELANGGILLLDEIHRLTPEGQEKLFWLIDHGVFRRMGETRQERRVNLLLIGATTEPPMDCMLSTFLRRIPVHIVLPALSERSVRERLELVFYFLWKESDTIRRDIRLRSEIISAFVHYHCYANIGQLEADIRLTCANAYYGSIEEKSKPMEIEFPHLSPGVQRGLFTSSEASSRLVRDILVSGNETMIAIDGNLPFRQVVDVHLIIQK